MHFEVQKPHNFPHTLHYCCSSMLRLSETHRILQSSSSWEARHALIGQLSIALWLAEYLKREAEMLRPSPRCDAMSWRDETKTIKPIIKEAFVASIGDIITDYNYLYCLFTLPCLFLWSENQQTTSTTLHCSKLAFESSVAETYFQAVTVLGKLEFAHFIVFTAIHTVRIEGYSSRFRK